MQQSRPPVTSLAGARAAPGPTPTGPLKPLGNRMPVAACRAPWSRAGTASQLMLSVVATEPGQSHARSFERGSVLNYIAIEIDWGAVFGRQLPTLSGEPASIYHRARASPTWPPTLLAQCPRQGDEQPDSWIHEWGQGSGDFTTVAVLSTLALSP